MNSENWDTFELENDYIKTYKMKFSNDYLFFTSNFMKELKKRLQNLKKDELSRNHFMLVYLDFFKRFRASFKYRMGARIKEEDKINTLEQFKIWYKKEKEEEDKIFFRAQQLAKIDDKYYDITEGAHFGGVVDYTKQYKNINFRDYITDYVINCPEDKENDISYIVASHMNRYTYEFLQRYHNGTLKENEIYEQ